jgi:hypothetical protein
MPLVLTPVTTAPAGGGTTPPPPAKTPCYFGVWDQASVNWNTPDGNPVGTWAGAAKFSAAPVRSVTYFAAWLSPFPVALNQLAQQHGATVYLNLEPQNTWGGGANPTVPDIAAGKYDTWLNAIGAAIKAGGNTVRVTWAHEMNGNWYPWGTQAVTAAQWLAGWKHVYQVLKAAAGDLCQMTWAPNNNDGGRAVTPFWPGDEWVDVVGMDAYLNTANASQTYASFVKPTVDEIAKLTSRPVWNAETGVFGSNRSARITQFVQDMRSDGRVSGFTWWNQDSYLLQPAELQALTAAVNAWDAS